MSDIVERLRDRDAFVMSGLFHCIPAMAEAADEIERLNERCHDLECRAISIRTSTIEECEEALRPCLGATDFKRCAAAIRALKE